MEQRYAQTKIGINDLPRQHRGAPPAWMIRQRLIAAGAPEGFSMEHVTQHPEDCKIVFTWMEPPSVSNEVQNCNDCQVPGCQDSDESCCTGFVGVAARGL